MGKTEVKAGEVTKNLGSCLKAVALSLTYQASFQDGNGQPTGLLLSGKDSKGVAHKTYPDTFLKKIFKWFSFLPVIKKHMDSEEKLMVNKNTKNKPP